MGKANSNERARSVILKALPAIYNLLGQPETPLKPL